MNEFSTIVNAVLPVFGIVLVGLCIRKANWLNEAADQSLLRININLLLPCLILDSTLGNPALLHPGNLLLAPVIGLATFLLGMFLALAAQPLHGLKEPGAKRTFALTVGMYNYGYIPIPLSMLLFDKQTTGVLMVHNVGVETALWTIGVALLQGGAAVRDWRKLVNPPLIAILIAIVMNFARVDSSVPVSVHNGIHWLGQCAIPMALILIGAIIADYMGAFHSTAGWRTILTAIFLRLGVLPILFLLIAKYLPCSMELKKVIVLEAAMPAAVFPIVMARHYGGDPPTALRVVIGTSLAGLATIPLWIHLGLRFLGLSGF